VSGAWLEAGIPAGWSTTSPAFLILCLQEAIRGPFCTPSSTTT